MRMKKVLKIILQHSSVAYKCEFLDLCATLQTWKAFPHATNFSMYSVRSYNIAAYVFEVGTCLFIVLTLTRWEK